MENETEIISLDANDIKRRIFTIRGKQVMLDTDLAELYQIQTKAFNQSVNRNIERFPERFRLRLTKEEYTSLVISASEMAMIGGKSAQIVPLPSFFAAPVAVSTISAVRITIAAISTVIVFLLKNLFSFNIYFSFVKNFES